MSGTRPNPSTTHDNAGIAAWRFKLSHEIDSYESAQEAERSIYRGLCPADVPNMVKALPYRKGYQYAYKIGANMWVADRGDYMCVVLYDTEIIRYYADGTFCVSNGGHSTITTKERLGAVLPPGFSPYHHKHLLGLMSQSLGIGHPRGGVSILWPLDHDRRINCKTGEVV